MTEPLPLRVGQTGTLTFMPTMCAVDPARVTKARWAPVGQDQTKVKWTTPAKVDGIAPGTRTFRVAVTCAPLTTGDPEETLTYEFVVACLTAGAQPVDAIVPIVIHNIMPLPPVE
jgi:hypothetical protein